MPPELKQRALKEPRITVERKTPGASWFQFEMRSREDFRDALWWLNPYERAK
jgi:hypothetical protein